VWHEVFSRCATPGTLARWLRGRGCDAVHALERDLGQTDDRKLWNISTEEGRIMISKDEDFFILAMRPKDHGRLLWLRVGNCRTTDLLTLLNRKWPAIAEAFEAGQQIVEVR
jgi:predicted nuclease of predicted toxin-antitoxin system